MGDVFKVNPTIHRIVSYLVKMSCEGPWAEERVVLEKEFEKSEDAYGFMDKIRFDPSIGCGLVVIEAELSVCAVKYKN